MERIKWIRNRQVAEHLGLDRQILRALMKRTAANSRVWVDVGLGALPRYRWERLEQAEAWLRAVGRDRG